MLTIEEIIEGLCNIINSFDDNGILSEEERKYYYNLILNYRTWHECFFEKN